MFKFLKYVSAAVAGLAAASAVVPIPYVVPILTGLNAVLHFLNARASE